MSVETKNSSFPLGNFITILRQRFFIDHSSEAKTFINEEYTIIANRPEGVTNIILQSTIFLPNLTVYDSDGETLPVMPNRYTRILIESWIEDATANEKQELTNLLQQMQQQRIFLLWIKLPPQKELKLHQVRTINLEYSAIKEKNNTDEITLDIFSPADHTVFYIIKKPEDYEFAKQEITTKDNAGKEIKLKSWKTKKQDLMYVSETFDTLSIASKPNMTQPIQLKYSFRSQWHIVSFPVSAMVLLTSFGLYLFVLQDCKTDPTCIMHPLSENSLRLLDNSVNIVIGIIAASLVLPRLITNAKIRHSMLMLYFVPIAIAIAVLI